MDLTPFKRMFVPACFFFGFLLLTIREAAAGGLVLIGLGFGGIYFKLDQILLLMQQGRLK
jgi:hypothetical protein